MRTILLLLVVFAQSAFAADVTGKWTGSGESNGESHPLVFVLKQDGDNLTGTGGPNETEKHEIAAGKVTGEKIIFDVPNGTGKFHFELTVDGDAMKGTVDVKSDEGTEHGTVSLKRNS